MAEVGKDYTGIWFHMLTSVPWICWKEKCRSHVTVAFRRVSWGFVSVTSEHDKIATFVDISQACCLKWWREILQHALLCRHLSLTHCQCVGLSQKMIDMSCVDALLFTLTSFLAKVTLSVNSESIALTLNIFEKKQTNQKTSSNIKHHLLGKNNLNYRWNTF